MTGIEIIDISKDPRLETYVEELYRLRQRKGLTRDGARVSLRGEIAFAAMMVRLGDADGMIAGISQRLPETIRPMVQILGLKSGVRRLSGVQVLYAKDRLFFFADTTVNIRPTPADLAEIARQAAQTAREFGVTPRVAFLSYSTFGSADGPGIPEVREALRILQQQEPELVADGEMQADTAVTPGVLKEIYPFSRLGGETANVLIFPQLESANMSYKLVQKLGGGEAIGPLLQGLAKPAHVVQPHQEMMDIVYMTAIAVIEASMQEAGRPA
jgi:malate dehydrogenase (oxaloacetate-decarboxylating)(NADP+)